MARFQSDPPAAGAALPDILTAQMSAPELNTLLLDVFQRRVQRSNPAALLAAYRQNRFVQPAALDSVAFRSFALLWLQAAQAQGFTPLELSPVSPLGTCSIVGTVHQDKVLSALRGTEVVADATNVLALESSIRRRDAGFRAEPLHFCTEHRHVRTPRVALPGFSQHFSVFCLTTAGRDTGHFQFEQAALTRHIGFYRGFLQEKLGQQSLKITLKALDPAEGPNALFDRMHTALQAQFPDAEIEVQRVPQMQQQYYRALQFGIVWEYRGHPYPIADGGCTTWTQQLTGNRKERFVSSGIGLELLWKLLNDAV